MGSHLEKEKAYGLGDNNQLMLNYVLHGHENKILRKNHRFFQSADYFAKTLQISNPKGEKVQFQP